MKTIIAKHYLTLLFLTILIPLHAQQIDMSLMKDIKPRNIGPAGMSGRVTAIDAVVSNPRIIYVGTASGGLWKSENGGTSYKPIFQNEQAASVGAVAINQNNPDEIWVGTGEGNPRNSLNSGFGIYKSLDGGHSWKYMGLGETRNIHRVIIHRDDPNTVIVGAIGSPWGEQEQRGVYKTTDGGKTWRKVLYVDTKTGIGDLVVDPTNPNKLIAAMWEHRRWPWYFKSGGPGSGLYVSYDGGESWEKRTSEDGLPKGELGRIGLAIAPSKPNIVYALVEAKKNGLYKSEDGGINWKLVSTKNIGARPFYYADIFVDPENENRIYNLYTFVDVSNDGGKTFERLINPNLIHVDNHAFWINPNDPNFLICGNDGGLCFSRDRGETWDYAENLPLAQFYHIKVDNAIPYNVYGGLQDNGSWRGPSQVWRRKGIRNLYWNRIGYGDGFDVVPDPIDERHGYALSQGGNLLRYDLATGALQGVRAYVGGENLRFNWNTGIAIDPFDKKTLYVGSQYLLKSTDKGNSWEKISDDLTTNDPEKQKQKTTGGLTLDNSGAENFTTIISVEPSPVQKDMIWVGTDDGNVQLTTDGGNSWTNFATKLPGAPKGGWVAQIRASNHNANEAFVVINNYRQNDWNPYLYRTKDGGRSWKRIADSNNVWGYVLSVVQDPVVPNLIFLGSEYGLYVSVDDGTTWSKWTSGYPTASTMDLQIQEREGDLVIGTFGRAVWILDDVRPLREMAKNGYQATVSKDLRLFDAPIAYLAQLGEPNGYRSTGDGLFVGKNRTQGALLTYYLKDIPAVEDGKDSAKVKVEVYQGNDLIRTLKHVPKEGMNRFAWNLTVKGVRFPTQKKPKPSANEPGGRRVVPGDYKVVITYNELKDSTTVNVVANPAIPMTIEEMRAKAALIDRHYGNVRSVTSRIDRLREAMETANFVGKQMKENDKEKYKDLIANTDSVKNQIKDLIAKVNPPENLQGFTRYPERIITDLQNSARMLQDTWFPATDTQRAVLNDTEKRIKPVTDAIDAFLENDWKAFRESVENSDFSLFKGSR